MLLSKLDVNLGIQLIAYWKFWYILVTNRSDFNWDSQQRGMDAAWSFAMQVRYIDCHWVLRQRLNYCEVIVTWSTSLFLLSSCRRIFIWNVGSKEKLPPCVFWLCPPAFDKFGGMLLDELYPRVKANKKGSKIFSGTSIQVWLRCRIGLPPTLSSTVSPEDRM